MMLRQTNRYWYVIKAGITVLWSYRTKLSAAVCWTARLRWWEMQCQTLQWHRPPSHTSPSANQMTTTSNPPRPCHFLTLTSATEPVTSCLAAGEAGLRACIDNVIGQAARKQLASETVKETLSYHTVLMSTFSYIVLGTMPVCPLIVLWLKVYCKYIKSYEIMFGCCYC